MKRRPIQDRLDECTREIVETYDDGKIRAHNLDQLKRLPSQEKTISILKKLYQILYPGFYGNQSLTRQNVAYHIGALLDEVSDDLDEQIYHACRISSGDDSSREECANFATKTVEDFISALPDIRRLLRLDVQAAFDGDPAAKGFAEIILAYPGFEAVTVYRLAHALYNLNVPLLPRMMTEYAHHKTGVDIHPGATIGKSFFIDHGTGVVIGETTEIGDNVKLYQGVTLGALSFPKDERGNVIRGRKRHPTIEDEVVIYSGATILGGETVIGKGSVVGGNTWLTRSLPPGSKVLSNPQEQSIQSNDDS